MKPKAYNTRHGYTGIAPQLFPRAEKLLFTAYILVAVGLPLLILFGR